MFFTGSFGKNIDILWRTMNASLIRRDVMSNNVANSDTPNFKRTDVNFESQLKRALASEKRVNNFGEFLTDEKHMPFDETMDYRDVKPRRVLDYLSTSKNNGNNVDIEAESMGLMQNQLAYTAMAQVVQDRFNKVNSVMR